MQANKLMIGDWVVNPVHEDARKIEGVYYDKELHCLVATDGRFPQEHFEPILLTPVILEKNGFILHGKTYILKWRGAEIHWRKTDGYASITAPNNLKLEGWCSILNGYFCYVHILQHALRLCGLTDLADNFKI